MDHPISSTYLDRQVARATAALPGAGALDAAPLELFCSGFKSVMLYAMYTRGGVGGAFDIQPQVKPAPSSGTVWYRMSAYSSGAIAINTDTTSNMQAEEVRYGAVGANAETIVFGPIELGGTVEQIRFPCQESGAVGTPGTLTLLAIFGM